MNYHLDDTIAAIATAPGGAARSIVRVSGPEVLEVVERLFSDSRHEESSGRTAATASAGAISIRLHGATRQIPCTLFCWPDRRSYTREPVAEFHTMGSPPIAQAVLAAACEAGARLAEPGEFTLRAFLAGRLDLTQAEAVLGVIDAHGEQDLRTAIEQLAGNLARPLTQLREELLMLLAEVEAGLDFVEEDIEFISGRELARRLEAISVELTTVERTMTTREAAKAVCQIALVGAPNAGKSSLFNALVDRYGVDNHLVSAIVSDVSGTTRDYLLAALELNGQSCELVDTAGVDAADISFADVEMLARERAAERRERSLLRVLCVDAAAPDFQEQASTADAELIAITKSDLAAVSIPTSAPLPMVATSSFTGAGLMDLVDRIAELLSSSSTAVRSGCVAATADRCRESIRKAHASVRHAAELARENAGDELVAAEIRTSLGELGKVVGAVYTDDLLDRIFSSFCIGK